MALGAVGVLNAVAASAQYGNRTFERSPAEGPRGTVIRVSGTGCALDGQPFQYAYVRLARRSGEDGGPPYDTNQKYPIGADGSWAGDFVVPQEAPPGNYSMTADCVADDMVLPAGESTFFVNSDPPIPPPSTTTTTSTSTTAVSTTTTSTTTTTVPASREARRSVTPTTRAATSTTVAETTTTQPPPTTQPDDDAEEAAPLPSPRNNGDSGPGLLEILSLLSALGVGTGVVLYRRRRLAP
jgi:hypothetical protein